MGCKIGEIFHNKIICMKYDIENILMVNTRMKDKNTKDKDKDGADEGKQKEGIQDVKS